MTNESVLYHRHDGIVTLTLNRPETLNAMNEAMMGEIESELHDELKVAGFAVSAGQMGENVTTCGIDLLALPTGTRLQLGERAVVEVTGLRNPCAQLDRIKPGLMAATLGRDEQGRLIRKAGVMAIVLTGGGVRPGDPIRVELPSKPQRPLEPV